jgi:hypothetical protein
MKSCYHFSSNNPSCISQNFITIHVFKVAVIQEPQINSRKEKKSLAVNQHILVYYLVLLAPSDVA